ncbi:lipoyl(octanoyl) transferase LipB [Leucobacter chromiiresistens]|uniref:Octanoyltransferase n=1 Tax=Leucobacter chromiiresistens TaxID=1079994 RepID=A0A1H1AIC6_9MICO|nr:lipoyl(octanoyl) transferase LipB [Leucobacter chromiiresistens]SDQ38986.1 lipoyl(octanoyl) transferase [Leucobacter chromiiresistens]
MTATTSAASRALPHPATTVAGLAPDLVPYARGLDLQAAAVARIERGADRGTVIMLEHESVYTAGRRADPEEYPADGSPVVPVDRGGRVTWHGPGQLVCYPVIRLRGGAGVVDLVRALETAIIAAMSDLGLAGARIEGRSGVWVQHHDVPAKVAQIGLHARAGIITHGIAVNCCNDPAPFAAIVPCGIRDAGVTTLSAMAGRRIAPAELAPFLDGRLAAAIAELVA